MGIEIEAEYSAFVYHGDREWKIGETSYLNNNSLAAATTATTHTEIGHISEKGFLFFPFLFPYLKEEEEQVLKDTSNCHNYLSMGSISLLMIP